MKTQARLIITRRRRKERPGQNLREPPGCKGQTRGEEAATGEREDSGEVGQSSLDDRTNSEGLSGVVTQTCSQRPSWKTSAGDRATQTKASSGVVVARARHSGLRKHPRV